MNIIPRTAWGAADPKNPPTSMTPTARPTLHWNGPATGLTPDSLYSAETEFMRGVQRFHQDVRGWNDFAYTLGFAPSGRVYEGRGWGHRTAANGTAEGNSASLAFFLMVGEGEPLSAAMVAAVNEAAADGRAGPGRGVKAHSDWKSTRCPGDEVRAAIGRGEFNSDGTGGDPHVAELQRHLNDEGPASAIPGWTPLTVDGIFGPKTLDAVLGHVTRSELLHEIEQLVE